MGQSLGVQTAGGGVQSLIVESDDTLADVTAALTGRGERVRDALRACARRRTAVVPEQSPVWRLGHRDGSRNGKTLLSPWHFMGHDPGVTVSPSVAMAVAMASRHVSSPSVSACSGHGSHA